MKIIILHGEDTAKLYERLKKFIDTAKNRSWEVSYIDESKENLRDQLSAMSLFGSERFFVMKDIKRFSKTDSEWLKKNYANLAGNLIIYFEGTLNQTFLKSLPKEIKIEEFKLPKLLWSFLEHIYPGNASVVIKEFHEIVKKDSPEFIFALLSKQFKDLYWVKIDPDSSGFPSWKISKLKSQSAKFDKTLLTRIIKELSKIDIEVKTSKTDLVSSLDLMFIKYIQ